MYGSVDNEQWYETYIHPSTQVSHLKDAYAMATWRPHNASRMHGAKNRKNDV